MKRVINSRIVGALAIVILLLAPLGTTAQTKRALLIGLGEQKDHRWDKINGDIDILIIMEVLKTSGYNKSNIITLVNKQATKAGIVNAFKTLTNLCRRGDIVYIHFSGHGQQMTDIDGDESENEGLDESWIPYDAFCQHCSQDNGSKHLSDDETGELLTNLRRKVGESGKILVVVDACHSGDSTHGTPSKDEVTRGTRDYFTIPHAKKTSNKSKTKEAWVSISACKANQTNQEHKLKADEKLRLERNLNVKINSQTVGKLTYAIYSILMEESNLSNDKFKQKLKDFMDRDRANGGNNQTPLLAPKNISVSISNILK